MSIEMNKIGNSSIKQSPIDETARPLLNDCKMNGKENTSQAELIENGKQSPDLTQEEKPPKDRYNWVMIFFLLHGVGVLMPWNAFINANSYFKDYKLTIFYENGTTQDSEHKEFFLSYLGITANVPGLCFNIFNIFAPLKDGNYTWRIVPAIFIEICVIIFTIILAVKDTQQWMDGFFYSTMISVVILNFANGIYQNSVFGLASKFPMRFTNYVVIGNNICGTFTALANIITLAISPNQRIAAVYYFVSALTILIIAIDTFLALPVNRFYRYHALGQCDGLIKNKLEKSECNAQDVHIPYWNVFTHCWKQCLNVFLVFFVTLLIFPDIQSDIRESNNNFLGNPERTKKYYVAVFCFLSFNASAMLGNLLPNIYIGPGPNKLWIPVILRFAFVPYFLFSNLLPDVRTLPIVFDNDILYVIVGILFGMSSGYLSSLAMMYAPRSAPEKYAGTAAMMAAACLMGGIFCGITASPYVKNIVKIQF